ncbi:hypothetical protein [Nonomuraea sp. NPDC049480]|uniref:hypothetical protein n=1 Tax=Nonomuraea sp. NPDC049480 TaxID=3364353 RepID=UPI003788B521
MTIFTSQFDRARDLSRTYAGEASDARFRTPAAIAATAALGVGAAALAASETATTEADASGDPAGTGQPADWAAGWGDGWDSGWETGAAAVTDEPGAAGADAWSHRGDHTDASVGGDGDFFYFIDGDSSLTIG